MKKIPSESRQDAGDDAYTERGNVLGKAWSLMRCGDKTDHFTHVHDPEHAMYGPYICPGFPEIKIYDTPPRKPVN